MIVSCTFGVPTIARADWVRDDQWQLGALNAEAAWRHTTGSGVIVAVLDSGVDATHPDLIGQVLPGIDLVKEGGDARTDPVGHGTTVAALIAGERDDAGVVGIAPDAKILPVRVLDEQNRYEDAAVVAHGLRWAVDHGASVVNLSLGGLAESEVLANAVAYAASRDVIVVACTGNVAQTNGPPQVWYPARQPGVLAVTGLRAPPSVTGGTGWADWTNGTNPGPERLWQGSLTGPQTVLSAPAASLLGARPGGYWKVQGTSFASPLVAAAAALVRSRYPNLSAANVINRLISTAVDLGADGRDDRYGFGQIDPLAALTAEVTLVSANPLTGPAGSPATSRGGSAGAPAPPANDPDAGNPAQAGTPADQPAPGQKNPSSSKPGSSSAPAHGAAGTLLSGSSSVPTATLAVVLVLAVAILLLHRRGYARRYLQRGRHSR
ncbi:S8 family serine peptidase [Virgisporangium aliadipatigenens]|uniref:S8 family serine peptidase n=1 Tax=Virgisporangium aliadipatigenens TaxID=741659 RepID=UPI001EF3B45B|nr:S8 family serine peptidase [Virgisporangium aliadipatigenens]